MKPCSYACFKGVVFTVLVNHHLKSSSIKALANEHTLLPTQMFPRLPAHATFVADKNFVSGTQKMVLILFRNILCPQQMFPSLRSPRNIMGNNVSATMCPRLPVPLLQHIFIKLLVNGFQSSFEIPKVRYELGNFITLLSIKLCTWRRSCEFHCE